MSVRACSGCAYFREGWVSDTMHVSSQCRKNPPNIFLVPGDCRGARPEPKSFWPEVQAIDWCGDWLPRTS